MKALVPASRIRLPLLACAAAALPCALGCGAPTAAFSTSADINGQDPGAATYAIFGAGVVVDATGGVGAPDRPLGQLLVLASDDPDLCAAVGDDALAFLDALEEGR